MQLTTAKRIRFAAKTMRTGAEYLFLLALAAAALAAPEAAARGIAEGIELCLSTAVPSLFFMMTLAVLTVRSGAVGLLGRKLSPAARFLFGLPGEAASVMLVAVTGGYPAGAKAACELCEAGAVTRAQAERMTLFCFCSGPAFILGAVGTLTGQRGALLLLGIQLAVVPMVGVISRLLPHGADDPVSTPAKTHDKVLPGVCSEIVPSVRQSASAMLTICLYIVLFSSLRELLAAFGVSGLVCTLLRALGLRDAAASAVLPVTLEVTSGLPFAARVGLPAVAFALGFGGLAVHMQVFALARPVGLRYSRFLLMRLLQGGLCALLTRSAVAAAPSAFGSFAAGSPGTVEAALSSTPLGSVSLLVMCIMCVLCLSDRMRRFDRC